MTNRYLLAAEADKIQDFIFRAAHLREVVGGSQLLVRFCDEAPHRLGVPPKDIVVAAGGSFRLLFDSRADALRFGERLAEIYRRAADGTLTVAQPVEVKGDYGDAAKEAEEELRRAKRRRKGAATSPQLPIIAFCANCGTGLAAAYVKRRDEDANGQHLCAACLVKAAERQQERRAGRFLERFYRLVAEPLGKALTDETLIGEAIAGATATAQTETARPSPAQRNDLYWPGHLRRANTQEFDPVEDVADYDARRYVAYLVADGNNMGQIFGLCRSEEQVRSLSAGLDDVVQKALAAPTQLMMRWAENSAQRRLIPVLPLILGGDDVFALLPAPWALDFAARFCREYAAGMKTLLASAEFAPLRAAYAKDMAERTGNSPAEAADALQPTMAVAVVICKASHPYALAHAAGHARLQQAKRAVKQLAEQQIKRRQLPEPHSAINFEVILGSQLVPAAGAEKLRPTLRPYWTEAVPAGWGLPIDRLIDQRRDLAGLPNKRLAQLRALFDRLPLSVAATHLQPWQRDLAYLLGRLERRGPHAGPVQKALAQLGSGAASPGAAPPTDPWCNVERGDDSGWYGHGLPDLIQAWDWTFSLAHDRAEYAAPTPAKEG